MILFLWWWLYEKPWILVLIVGDWLAYMAAGELQRSRDGRGRRA